MDLLFVCVVVPTCELLCICVKDLLCVCDGVESCEMVCVCVDVGTCELLCVCVKDLLCVCEGVRTCELVCVCVDDSSCERDCENELVDTCVTLLDEDILRVDVSEDVCDGVGEGICEVVTLGVGI